MCVIEDHLIAADKLIAGIDFTALERAWAGRTYTLDEGRARCKVIYDTSQIEVINCELCPGGTIPPHTHEQLESFAVYEGELSLITEAGGVQVDAGTSFSVPPMTLHHIESKRGAKVIITRVPSCGVLLYE